ncbi:phosphoribosyltransferase [Alteribacter keqinensis]|uniref:Phosphoribosyltransferase domain-containing protein n=1 Tax=Alteribacter keqinensis TaxID=2483800 RepID=A0A3M7TXX4_9BACI|nr:phosphoribosyltransferase family protein [Alteribacter keqinensis]RNA70343.1 hypothetical protein EBO34_10575 [Alteribacter keqinensis]
MKQKTNHVYLNYNAISQKLDTLAPEIREQAFDGLVILLRGGSFAGMHLTFLTGLPYFFLTYDRKTGQAEWFGAKPYGKRLLLVEDFAGSGKTLIDSAAFLKGEGVELTTLVVCKDSKSASTPDYICFNYAHTDYRIFFPWERHRINNEAVGKRHGAETGKPDHEYEKALWDTRAQSGEGKAEEGDGFISLDGTQPHFIKHNPVFYINIHNKNEKEIAAEVGKCMFEQGYTHVYLKDSAVAALLSVIHPEIRVIWEYRDELISINGST